MIEMGKNEVDYEIWATKETAKVNCSCSVGGTGCTRCTAGSHGHCTNGSCRPTLSESTYELGKFVVVCDTQANVVLKLARMKWPKNGLAIIPVRRK